jgi:hypothetical protein
MTELWQEIPGYPGYEASSEGRVRSLDREDVAGRKIKGRILQPGILQNGRLQVVLCGVHGKKQIKVHQAVALAFHGPCPEGKEVRHWPDRDVKNNRPENLSYGTKVENHLDSVAHGTHKELCKTECQLGHPLLSPNLRERRSRPEWRECLACHRARWMVRHRPELDIKDVADACFREVDEGMPNPYRRSKSEAAFMRRSGATSH